MTWCDGCCRPHQHVTEHLAERDDTLRIELLCGDCWRFANYWDDIAPRHKKQVAA